MRSRKFLCALVAALFAFQTLNLTALADEGMWTFNNVPKRRSSGATALT